VLDITAQNQSGRAAPNFREELRRLWYDTAGFPVPMQLPVLLDVVDPSRVLYGSDFCWTRAEPAAAHARTLDRYYAERADDWRTDFARNASVLFGP